MHACSSPLPRTFNLEGVDDGRFRWNSADRRAYALAEGGPAAGRLRVRRPGTGGQHTSGYHPADLRPALLQRGGPSSEPDGTTREPNHLPELCALRIRGPGDRSVARPFSAWCIQDGVAGDI